MPVDPVVPEEYIVGQIGKYNLLSISNILFICANVVQIGSEEENKALGIPNGRIEG